MIFLFSESELTKLEPTASICYDLDKKEVALGGTFFPEENVKENPNLFPIITVAELRERGTRYQKDGEVWWRMVVIIKGQPHTGYKYISLRVEEHPTLDFDLPDANGTIIPVRWIIQLLNDDDNWFTAEQDCKHFRDLTNDDFWISEASVKEAFHTACLHEGASEVKLFEVTTDDGTMVMSEVGNLNTMLDREARLKSIFEGKH